MTQPKLREILEKVYLLGFEHGSSDNQTLKRAVQIDINQAHQQIIDLIKEIAPDEKDLNKYRDKETVGWNAYYSELMRRIEE